MRNSYHTFVFLNLTPRRFDIMSLPSSIQERRPRSHSTSPLFQSHSAEDSDDGQSNGYQGVNAPQQHEAVEMTRLNYSKRDVSPVSTFNARSPTPPGKQNTAIHTTETEDHHPIYPIYQSRALLYDKTGRVRNIVGRFWLWEF